MFSENPEEFEEVSSGDEGGPSSEKMYKIPLLLDYPGDYKKKDIIKSIKDSEDSENKSAIEHNYNTKRLSDLKRDQERYKFFVMNQYKLAKYHPSKVREFIDGKKEFFTDSEGFKRFKWVEKPWGELSPAEKDFMVSKGTGKKGALIPNSFPFEDKASHEKTYEQLKEESIKEALDYLGIKYTPSEIQNAVEHNVFKYSWPKFAAFDALSRVDLENKKLRPPGYRGNLYPPEIPQEFVKIHKSAGDKAKPFPGYAVSSSGIVSEKNKLPFSSFSPKYENLSDEEYTKTMIGGKGTPEQNEWAKQYDIFSKFSPAERQEWDRAKEIFDYLQQAQHTSNTHGKFKEITNGLIDNPLYWYESSPQAMSAILSRGNELLPSSSQAVKNLLVTEPMDYEEKQKQESQMAESIRKSYAQKKREEEESERLRESARLAEDERIRKLPPYDPMNPLGYSASEALSKLPRNLSQVAPSSTSAYHDAISTFRQRFSDTKEKLKHATPAQITKINATQQQRDSGAITPEQSNIATSQILGISHYVPGVTPYVPSAKNIPQVQAIPSQQEKAFEQENVIPNIQTQQTRNPEWRNLSPAEKRMIEYQLRLNDIPYVHQDFMPQFAEQMNMPNVHPVILNEIMNQMQGRPTQYIPMAPKRNISQNIMSSFNPNMFSPEFIPEEEYGY